MTVKLTPRERVENRIDERLHGVAIGRAGCRVNDYVAVRVVDCEPPTGHMAIEVTVRCDGHADFDRREVVERDDRARADTASASVEPSHPSVPKVRPRTQ